MSPTARKLLLTVHVICSVGWLGSVAAFLALAIVGLTSADVARMRGAYVAMDIVTWTVIVPTCLASFVSGVVQGLATPWGLLRHYWVLIKLVLTVLATLILLAHTHPIGTLADAAASGPFDGHRLHELRTQLIADAGAALLVLVTATVLSVFKPRGVTGYGRRRGASAETMS